MSNSRPGRSISNLKHQSWSIPYLAALFKCISIYLLIISLSKVQHCTCPWLMISRQNPMLNRHTPDYISTLLLSEILCLYYSTNLPLKLETHHFNISPHQPTQRLHLSPPLETPSSTQLSTTFTTARNLLHRLNPPPPSPHLRPPYLSSIQPLPQNPPSFREQTLPTSSSTHLASPRSMLLPQPTLQQPTTRCGAIRDALEAALARCLPP